VVQRKTKEKPGTQPNEGNYKVRILKGEHYGQEGVFRNQREAETEKDPTVLLGREYLITLLHCSAGIRRGLSGGLMAPVFCMNGLDRAIPDWTILWKNCAKVNDRGIGKKFIGVLASIYNGGSTLHPTDAKKSPESQLADGKEAT